MKQIEAMTRDDDNKYNNFLERERQRYSKTDRQRARKTETGGTKVSGLLMNHNENVN